MRKEKVKTNQVTGFRIAVMIISILLLSLIMAFSMLLGLSSLKHNGPVGGDENATTVRKKLPTDGTLPTKAKPIDNIGYMAYVLDHQPSYHVYAKNSTKSTGYEQVTRSWKDYKNAELSGVGASVMVCSDISYSMLIGSSSQSCFIGNNEAHIRSGSRPNKNSTPSDINWDNGAPTTYDNNGYKKVYGEFSTEISVYALYEKSLIGADDVVDNGDGTYTQKYYLNENAACWYQYGMKTRGGLKDYPKFKKIEITFTFDAKWQILSSYCEEKATISPRALGGMNLDSSSKTTTEYSYSQDGFDNGHFAYFNNYFKQYKGTTGSNTTDTTPKDPEITDILMGGFGKVLDGGQQFDIALTLGETDYEGQIFLSLPLSSLEGDILKGIDLRIALGKKGSGKQDLYAELNKGAVNVYYSTDFALTCDISKISEPINNIKNWVNGITSAPAVYASEVDEQEESGTMLDSLFESLKLDRLTDTEAVITLKSDDLLGLGIGVNLEFGFERSNVNNVDSFSVKSLNLYSVEYDKTKIDVSIAIEPNGDEPITRDTENTKADLAEYINSVYNLLKNNKIKIYIGLDDTLIEGLKLNASSHLFIAKDIAAVAEIEAEYKGISLKLNATYIYEKTSYGKIYLHVSEFNGKEVNAKVYCNIEDTVNAVKDIIALFESNGEADGSTVTAPETKVELATIINKVLNLNFSEIIGNVKGDADSISVDLNVDNLLAGLDVSLGFNFGTLALSFDREPAKLSGSLSGLGLNVEITGSDKTLTEVDAQSYVDITAYVEGVYSLLNKPSYDVTISLEGTKITDKIDLSGLTVNGVATVAIENKTIRVKLPVAVSYGDLSVKLTAYYTINISDGSYGNVYLHVTEFCGKEVNAKVYCEIKDLVDSVNGIIAKFASNNKISVASEEASLLSKAIETLLNLDYNEIIHATNDKLSVSIDVDEILSSLDISLGGITFGELNLEFVPQTATLGGTLEKLGLTVGLNGNENSLAPFDGKGYVDLNAFVSGIAGIVNSEVYEIGVKFNGGEITDKIDLSGLTLNATAYAKLENGHNNITVTVPMLISYYGLEVELTAYYSADINTKDFSTVYICLTRIDQTQLNAKVYCDVQDAIGAVKDIINSFNQTATYSEESDGAADIVSKLVGVVLNLNYSDIIKCSQNNLSVTLDVDEILSQLDITVGGIKFGNLQLDLTLDNGNAQLCGKLDNLGVEMSLKGNDSYKMPTVNKGEYLDLTAALRLVEKMIDEGRKIAEAKDVAFVINGTATIGGVQVEVTGSGEVIWADGALKVALSLSVKVDGEILEINIVYDKDSNPFVILTVNDAGVKITNVEIDKLVNSFKGLIDAFAKGDANGENVGTDEVETYAIEVGGYSLEEIAKNKNVKIVLNALLGFVNEFTVQIENNPSDIYNLIISHSDGINVTLGADGCLSLEVAKADNKLCASVEVGNGATVSSILEVLANEKTEENVDGKYTYYELSKFVKVLYNAFFDKTESLTEILGDKAYSVTLNLTGANSGLSVLEGVSVNAQLYYGEGVVGTQRATKLMHVSLEMNINGTYVCATASYSGRTLFIELNKIGGTTFTGIKFKTDVENVFDAAEELVRLITDTNLVETLNTFMGKGSLSPDEVENIAVFAAITDENGQSSTSALTKLIDALLSLDLDKSFKFDKKTNTAEINVDSITEAVLNIKLGTITATYNDNTISATVKTEESDAWLSLTAAACENRKNVINPDDYTDIGFISTLLSDLVGTVTDADKQIHKLYTFTGNITVNVNIPVLSQTIELKNATLTVGLDSNDKFYLTLAASLQSSLATAKSDISVTYSDGLIVLGRNIESDNKEFKVLTFEYFLDNVLDKNNSPAKWLLGTSDFLWSSIISFIKVDINSGLTKAKTYTLYEELKQNVKEGKFNLEDYLSGMCVKAGGNESVYGNGASLAETKFNLANDLNHYAFDINAGELTGGTLSALCAVILRNDNGLSGLKAYGEVGTFVDFTLDFGTYIEGATDIYGDADNTKKLGETAVRNYLDYVTQTYGFDRNHKFENTKSHITPVFGCYSSNGNSYVSSDMLETIYLDVYAEDKVTVERTLEVLYGSTVKLVSNFPEFADDSKTTKLIYVNDNGANLYNEIVISDEAENIAIVYDADGKGRVSIYKSSAEAVEVIFNFVRIDGMNPVSAAFVVGDTLYGYELNDYSFLGWYKEEDFVTRVTKVNRNDIVDGKINVYGKYIKTLYEAENGVNYSFDTKLDAYYVSGVNDNIATYYNNADLWLEIASEINGYPVKYIGANAFANKDSENLDKSLVNVLVPETVTAVYDNAFLDNKALRQVAFFADKVFFGGRADSNGKTSVFYGCYSGKSANNSAFTVYYNGTQNNPYSHVITTNNVIDTAWNRIYFNNNTSYTMSTQSSGWAYVEFKTEVVGLDGNNFLPAEADLSGIINNGICFTAYAEAGNLANAISETLVAQLGMNIYDVTVSDALPLDGKRHSINITLTEHEEIVATTVDIDIVVKFGDFEYTTTVDGVEPEANLAAIYTTLNFEGKGDYAFIGWYTDEALKQLAPDKNNGTVTKLYAKLVLNTVTADNGVVYSFVNDHYAVSGFNTNHKDNVNYSEADKWLILENEISGIAVTAIANEAFANQSLKNVVVPSNITKLETKAFLNNYGMLNVVLLADNVTMDGSASGKNLPFYGCSTGNGTSQTWLNVYYNSVTPETQWNHFRDGNNYIGVGNAGGSINGAGYWGYVNYTVNGYDYAIEDFGYADGLVTTGVNDDYLNSVKSMIISQLNSESANEGVIYKYSVLVTAEKVNGIYNVTVTISDDAANAWHKLTIDGSDIQIELSTGIEVVNGTYFVKKNTTVTVKAVSGNEGLTRLTVYADEDKSTVIYDSGDTDVCANLTFEMPSQFAYVTAERDELPITEITLRSTVEVEGFAWNGSFYEKTVEEVTEGDKLPAKLSAKYHTFLDWAYENSSNVLEFETTIQHRVYYAVWAFDRTEVYDVSITDGKFTASIAKDSSDKYLADSIYGWYAFEEVGEDVVFNTPVTPSTLTVATTVVYPRMVFSFTYVMECPLGGAQYYYVREDTNDSKETKKNGTHTGLFDILEGTELKYLWAYKSDSDLDTNKVLRIDYVDQNANNKTLYFRIKYSKYAVGSSKTSKVELSEAISNTDIPIKGGDSINKPVDGNKELKIVAIGAD
ncbi:MAG: leucine-rich repeat protein [Clostridia bacterium]|nr:leucine-rich repeat protein [Clostridia bacterium]